MTEFKRIPILPVARLSGLELRREDYVEVEAKCPYCNDYKYRMYLNTETDTFFCHNCSKRGNSLILYANMCLGNDDYREAYRVLTQDSHLDISLLGSFRQKSREPEREPRPLADRHDVYYDMLSMLTLSKHHWNSLVDRGLDAEAITALKYRTVPHGGAADAVAQALSRKHDLLGIPGFYTGTDGRWHMMERTGLLIPQCTVDGYIQGYQIRLDNPEKAGRKFRLFSSRYKLNGTRSYPYFHVTGNTSQTEAFLTEGPMKADIANFFTRGEYLFVGQAGVNNQSGLAELMRSLGVTCVHIAYDMDRQRNPGIQADVEKAKSVLSGAGIRCSVSRWDEKFNGIDDYLHSKHQQAA
ncbi:DUF3854 domain-containing protein [Oscillospiraceae bacterium OttesenSCG-928-F05]|nr:DUF3854 domain-containing protein [Oscillospiraceae bacterium OttesenSCG-928-F05]